MVSIAYTGDYLSKENVEQCFVSGKTTYVDKTYCGNGFTTAFLKMQPKQGMCNIIIAPNKKVITNKQKQERKNLRSRIGFIYGGADSDVVDFDKYDVMMFVSDSFLLNFNNLDKYRNRIDKIMIDEFHSTLIQSDFRNKLEYFVPKVEEFFNDKAICCVTATPMMFQKIDFKFNKEGLIPQEILYTPNQEKSLERLENCLKEQKNVIVATQDAGLVAKLKEDNKLKANFIFGERMFQNLVERCEIKQDAESNLTIMSSTGFEGHDVYGEDYHIFIYEDRSLPHSTFFVQNVIQIIGRARDGVKYVEYCRCENSKGYNIPSREWLKQKHESDRISLYKKMTDNNYRDYAKYHTFNGDYDGLNAEIVFNEVKYNLDVERDTQSNILALGSYLQSHNFKLIPLIESPKRLSSKKPSERNIIKNIIANRDVIKNNHIFEELRLELLKVETTKQAVKEILKMIRRREYLNLTDDCNIEDFATHEEERVLHYLKDKDVFERLLEYIVKEQKARKVKEYNGRRDNKSYKQDLSEFETDLDSKVIQLLLTISQERVIPAKIQRINRDYNIFARMPLWVCEYVLNMSGKMMIEYDIRTCNPRILYAHNSLILPENFYGENKENKKSINIGFNMFTKRKAEIDKVDAIKRKERLIKTFRSHNVDEKAIQYLIDLFWEKHPDEFFNWCAYHERKILDRVIKEFIRLFQGTNISVVRRHDSVLVIGDVFELSKDIMSQMRDFLTDFEYEGQKGWFFEDKCLKINTEDSVEIASKM